MQILETQNIHYKDLKSSNDDFQRRQWHPLQYFCLENPMDREAW